ncbi:MAG: hypothetical protein IID40_05085, partial [Planctomycetes bacterium]|nr:hypothetical protein [Planctomycetota bacterium]
MRHIGEFTRPGNMKFSCGAKVVVQTKRGIEVGEQVSLACGGCDRSVSREQIQAYVRRSGPEHFELSSGRVLRLASEQDLADLDHINMDCATKQRFCQELTERHNLDMKVVTCEHLFGGERIIFYFMAQGRVDFRNLVKDLAQEYQTRIELRQVGARDEARLVADYETCGRECCCRSFLKTLKPVTMKMAKLQKATLDPSKVSGRCGRLKCCLRYEHTSYEELDRTLPRIGKLVRTQEGEGRVVGRQILTQLLQIQTAGGTRFGAAVEDLLGPDEPRAPEAPAPKMPETPAPPRQADRQPAADQGVAAGKGKRRRRRRAKGPRPVEGGAPGATPLPQPGPTGTPSGDSAQPGPTDAPETEAGSTQASAEQTPTDQVGGSAESTPNRRRGGRRRSRSRRGGGRDGQTGGGAGS